MSETIALNDNEMTNLGFGCAGMMRISTRKGRQRILEEVFDAGVRHLDLARMYGLGKVENEVGEFIQDKRDEVILATKFGIEVNERGSLLSNMQPVARQVIRYIPGLRSYLRKRSRNFYAPRDFSVSAAEVSLEKSLKALRTDYIDMFLLHEPTLLLLENTNIYEFLLSAKEKGLIREWGIAGYPDQIRPICEKMPELANIIQLPNDAVKKDLQSFRKYEKAAFITFSPLSDAYEIIKQHLKDKSALKRWNEYLLMDMSKADNLAGLLLAFALQANINGVVLFSTTRKQGVKTASDIWRNPPSKELINKFLTLISNEILNESEWTSV